LTKRYRIWNKERTKVKQIVVVFDMAKWTTELELLSKDEE
jgi:hypothetical protein